jgi:hypothetical protein
MIAFLCDFLKYHGSATDPIGGLPRGAIKEGIVSKMHLAVDASVVEHPVVRVCTKRHLLSEARWSPQPSGLAGTD